MKSMKTRKERVKSSPKRRVLIVDDHPVLREGLTLVINQQDDLLVCGEAEDAPQAMAAVVKLKPDVAVVDISLGESNGLELIKDLHALHPRLRMLALSMHDEVLYAERVLRAGARGYIMKREPSRELLGALRKILEGGLYTSQKIAGRMMSQLVGQKRTEPRLAAEWLSDRELEVFQLIGEGLGTREIAGRLHLSMKTVSCYRQNIKMKLDLPDATALTQHAVHWASTGRGN